MRVNVKVDAEKASDEFKQARRELNKRAGEAAVMAGKRVALPEARRRAPGFVKSVLTVKRSGKGAVLTTTLRGKKSRVVGLLEHSGTVRTVIVPKSAKAVLVNGQPVARVDTPRKYRGKHFLRNAVESKQTEIQDAILEETMKSFDGLEHTP